MGAMGVRGARAALWGAALLCVLGLGQHSPGARSCGPGCVLRGTGEGARCCGSCVSEACPKANCACVEPGFHCADPQCETCKRHPCPAGQEVKAHGEFTFGFECVDCAAGTFSGGSRGCCKPWADCSQPGFRTVFPGNKTHNAVCGPALLPTEPRLPLTLLLPVATCTLVLAVVQLSLHIWQLRRQRVCSPETQLLLEAPPPAEDACSCQFPEEEWGEQPSEDKGQLGNL